MVFANAIRIAENDGTLLPPQILLFVLIRLLVLSFSSKSIRKLGKLVGFS